MNKTIKLFSILSLLSMNQTIAMVPPVVNHLADCQAAYAELLSSNGAIISDNIRDHARETARHGASYFEVGSTSTNVIKSNVANLLKTSGCAVTSGQANQNDPYNKTYCRVSCNPHVIGKYKGNQDSTRVAFTTLPSKPNKNSYNWYIFNIYPDQP